MTTETMTITEALKVSSTIEDRLNKLLKDFNPVGAKLKSYDTVDGKDAAKFAEDAKSTYDKINDLLKRNNAIKKAVNLSNAQTTITVLGKEMTVAEAIYMNRNGICLWQSFLGVMERSYSDATEEASDMNEKLDRNADAYVASIANGNSTNLNSDAIESLRKNYIDNMTGEVFDPINCKDKITVLQDKIDKFYSACDSALQASNATTTITIEY